MVSALDAATISANVSYKDGPTRAELWAIFETGSVDPRFAVHVNHLLTETPMAIIEAAALEVVGDPAAALACIEKLKKAMSLTLLKFPVR